MGLGVRAVVNPRAKMKTWPIIVVCMTTGATHIMLAHNYGAEAFLILWECFIAIHERQRKNVSDQGTQLTVTATKVTRNTGQKYSWEWDKKHRHYACQNMVW